MKKYAKTTLCMALSAAMLFTSTGMTVLAEENAQAEETQQEVQAEETSTDKVPVEEEITEEAPVREETTEQVSEEKDSVEEAEESTVTEKNSDDNVISEEQIDSEDASAEKDLTQKTESEVASTEGVVDAEEDLTVQTESEVASTEDVEETEVSENELKLVFSDTDIAHDEYKDEENGYIWVIDADGNLTVEGTMSYGLAYKFRDYMDQIKTAKINAKLDNWGYTFQYWYVDSLDLSGCDISEVTKMEGMFQDCHFGDLNITGWDTSNVTNMNNMFQDSGGNYDFLKNLDTSGLSSMDSMFAGCRGLTSLEFMKDLDTSKVTNMSGTFSGCTGLTNVDMSMLDTSSVTNIGGMFSGCSGLTSLDVSSFDTSKITNISGMFSGCSGLTSLDVSNFNTSKVNDMRGMFSGCSGLTSLDVSNFDTSNVTGMYGMFGGCSGLKSLDVSNFDTSNVTGMYGMFEDCSGLTSLDVSNFDTSNVTAMDGMFSGCSGLTSLDVSNFDTSNVRSMDEMFSGCSGLTSLNISNFDTSYVWAVTGMFKDCSGLTSLDISAFDTSNVTSMYEMFSGCSGLTSLDVSSFDTSKVTLMSYMFGDCSKLTSLNVNGFNVSNVTTMEYMFGGCSGLTDLDLSSWCTYNSNVESMGGMFNGCSRLTSLDLSNFDVGNTTFYDYVYSYLSFEECDALRQIRIPKNASRGDGKMQLPSGTWYDMKGNAYTGLSKTLPSYSILLQRDEIPTEVEEYIVATSPQKTIYNVGEEINLSGMKVKYYKYDGTIDESLNGNDFTINKDEIDMSTSGTKTLIITYKDMTAEIKLLVVDKKAEPVTISGLRKLNLQYTGTAEKASYWGTPKVKTRNGTDVTNKVTLTYTYSGTQANNSSYGPSADVPVNAGVYTLTVAVSKDNKDYTGSAKIKFEIIQIGLSIIPNDIKLKTGDPLPQEKDYQYKVSGLILGENLIVEPTLTCNITDTTVAGTYDIIASGADAGMNYKITYENGTLTVSESEETEESSSVEESSKTEESNTTEESSKTEESSTTEESSKTEESSSTEESSTEDKDDSPYEDSERIDLKSASAVIANIKAKVYDGNAYEPVVKVTATVDGKKITLTEGADYRVLYKNNVNAGTGTVVVRGNGEYKGEIPKDFTISQKPIKKLKVLTGGISGVGSLQTCPVYVYDGTKLLQSGKDYTLSDYTIVKANSAQVTVKAVESGNYTGSVVAKLTVYEEGAKIISPENVKLKETAVAYTGKAVKPEVTVTVDNTPLTNKDYKVQYQNNKDAGTAYVIVTGKGAYKGKAVVPFTIKAETNGFTIKEIKAATYNGKLQKPAVSVSIQKNGKAKKLSKKDYTVTYKNNLHAGKAAVIVTGKGNYAGLSATAEFTINPQQIKKASLKGTQGSLVLMYNKRKLKEGTDYEKPVYGAVNKNKVTVTITGKGDFTDKVTKTVKTQ